MDDGDRTIDLAQSASHPTHCFTISAAKYISLRPVNWVETAYNKFTKSCEQCRTVTDCALLDQCVNCCRHLCLDCVGSFFGGSVHKSFNISRRIIDTAVDKLAAVHPVVIESAVVHAICIGCALLLRRVFRLEFGWKVNKLLRQFHKRYEEQIKESDYSLTLLSSRTVSLSGRCAPIVIE